MMRSILLISLLALGLSRYSQAEDKIVVSGTGDSQDLLGLLALEFEKANPGKVVEVPDSIGSSGGIRAVAQGQSDLGQVARPLTIKEEKYGVEYKVFAFSPVVIVVNKSVRAPDNITSAQLVAIYSSHMTSWADLGGADRKIYVANRGKGDLFRTVLEADVKEKDAN